MVVKVAQLWLTLCNPIDCSLPGSSVHGILQTRMLKWVAMPFSGGSSQPRDRTLVSCIAGRFFTVQVTREALEVSRKLLYTPPHLKIILVVLVLFIFSGKCAFPQYLQTRLKLNGVMLRV